MSDAEPMRSVRHLEISVTSGYKRAYGTVTRKATLSRAGFKDEHHEWLMVAVTTDTADQATALLCAYLTGNLKE